MVGRNPASNFKESKKINPFSAIQYRQDKTHFCATRAILNKLIEVIIKWECLKLLITNLDYNVGGIVIIIIYNVVDGLCYLNNFIEV